MRGIRGQNPWMYLKDIVKEYQPEFVCIAEPLIRPPLSATSGALAFGFDSMFLHNDSPSKVGNIWVCWREGKVVTLYALSQQHITVKTGNLFLSSVHANSAYGIRRALWAELSQLGLAVEPWAVVGDFNIVSEISERKGGGTPCLAAMSDFNSFIHSNAVTDSTTMGFKYSWCNKRMGHRRMYQKIDRMLVNQRWLDVDEALEAEFTREEDTRSLSDCGLEH
ncbi:hypothetical protein IFM89_008496 [Coptis chinensis]|uniref:Endonuclease/exonuclease/phosphatase domain-containing protein n=1 Tax=Coptis chinensis TaxID=261450 RepID=A0A835H3B9_9MAGN|nr:hypothetical protein IFM89_008496 [Coptis chinensis]